MKQPLYLCFMFWKYLFYIFLAYSLYQLVFKFIIPVYRTTRRVKKGFREMQEKMAQHQQQQANPYQQTSKSNINAQTNTEGEYIDFEEVKD